MEDNQNPSVEVTPAMLVRPVLDTDGNPHVLFSFTADDGREWGHLMPSDDAADYARMIFQHAEAAKTSAAFYKFCQEKLGLESRGAQALYQDFVVFVQARGLLDVPEVKGHGAADGIPDDISGLFPDQEG